MAIGGLAPDLSTHPKISRGKDCFLVANSNSVRGFLRPWVGPSVRGSVSVRRFSKTANSTKFKKIQVNSTKFMTFRSCWPDDGLVSYKKCVFVCTSVRSPVCQSNYRSVDLFVHLSYVSQKLN